MIRALLSRAMMNEVPRTSLLRVSLCLLGATVLSFPPMAAAQTGRIGGTVRDSQGRPVEGAQVTMLCAGAAEQSVRTTSDASGAYRFAVAQQGSCSLSATRSGYSAAAALTVAAGSATADLTLVRLPQAAGTTPGAKPQFEAAGVRGLIDPGGYSAPANAAAAAGLISGIADIRRADSAAASGGAASCGLEPELIKTFAASPQSAEANRKLGEFYVAHGAARQAVPYFERAGLADGSSARASYDLAQALIASEQFEAARGLLVKLSANQRTPGYEALLARADEGLGQFTEAAAEYGVAAEKDPSVDNLFGAGYELILAGRPADAAKAFERGVAHYPRSATLATGLGTAEFLQGHSGAAVTLFLRAVDLEPADARPYPFLAGAFMASGESAERVRASLKRHLDLNSSDAEATYLYAWALSRPGAGGEAADDARVEELLKQAIALDAKLAKAHFQLGTLYARRDDQRAAAEFEAALRSGAASVSELKEAHYRLAAAYRKLGRPAEAEVEMKRFREAAAPKAGESADGGASLDQFLSVVARPGVTATAVCPKNSGR